eukprot:TRINITY_DN17397_c0_g2_i1.p1 TRINITY_DN17397_c0_g2~~TRINITY_DN17397_c0_g2_i1.p1  ORF type:complete len:647 (-),score=43.86 TRINITY_DN17397_c0_g2_i1:72-2012(-)
MRRHTFAAQLELTESPESQPTNIAANLEAGQQSHDNDEEVKGTQVSCFGAFDTVLRISERQTHFEVQERIHSTCCHLRLSRSHRISIHSVGSIVAVGFDEGPRQSFLTHATVWFFIAGYTAALYQTGILTEVFQGLIGFGNENPKGFFRVWVVPWVSSHLESYGISIIEHVLGYSITGFGIIWLIVTVLLMLMRNPYLVVAVKGHPLEDALVPHGVNVQLSRITANSWMKRLLNMCLDKWEADLEELTRDDLRLYVRCSWAFSGIRFETRRAGIVEKAIVMESRWIFLMFPLLFGYEFRVHLHGGMKRISFLGKPLLEPCHLGKPVLRLSFPLGEESLCRVKPNVAWDFIDELVRLKMGNQGRFIGAWCVGSECPTSAVISGTCEIHKSKDGDLVVRRDFGEGFASGVLTPTNDLDEWLQSNLFNGEGFMGRIRMRFDESLRMIVQIQQRGHQKWQNGGVATPVEHVFAYRRHVLTIRNQTVTCTGWFINYKKASLSFLSLLLFLIYPASLSFFVPADPEIFRGGVGDGIGLLIKSATINVFIVVMGILLSFIIMLSAFEWGNQIYFREDLTHVRIDRAWAIPWCCCPWWCKSLFPCGLCGCTCPTCHIEMKFAAIPLQGFVRYSYPIEQALKLQALLCAHEAVDY